MQIAQLKNKQGAVILELPLPSTLYEVPLNRYIDFITEYSKADTEPSKQVECTMNAVCAFYGIRLTDALSALYGSHTEAEVKRVEIDSVSKLHGHAIKLIDTHLNENYKRRYGKDTVAAFSFCGEQFTTPILAIQVLGHGIEKLPNLTVHETVEALEIKRVCEQLIFDEQDPDGSHLYARYLKLLAVFVRKEGEVLPYDEQEREQFIQERAAFFGGVNEVGEIINAGLSLDIDFFLTSFSGRLTIRPVLLSFLTLRSLALVAQAKMKLSHLQGQSAKHRNTEKKSLSVSGGVASLPRSSKRAISRELKKKAR